MIDPFWITTNLGTSLFSPFLFCSDCLSRGNAVVGVVSVVGSTRVAGILGTRVAGVLGTRVAGVVSTCVVSTCIVTGVMSGDTHTSPTVFPQHLRLRLWHWMGTWGRNNGTQDDQSINLKTRRLGGAVSGRCLCCNCSLSRKLVERVPCPINQ